MLGMAIALCRGMQRNEERGNKMNKLMETGEWILSGLGIALVGYLAAVAVYAVLCGVR